MEKKLGSGNFGIVYKGTTYNTWKTVYNYLLRYLQGTKTINFSKKIFLRYTLAVTGKWRGNVDVAIKQLKNLDTDRLTGRDAIQGFEKAREEFFKECNILRILHHPHLVQVIHP